MELFFVLFLIADGLTVVGLAVLLVQAATLIGEVKAIRDSLSSGTQIAMRG